MMNTKNKLNNKEMIIDKLAMLCCHTVAFISSYLILSYLTLYLILSYILYLILYIILSYLILTYLNLSYRISYLEPY
jgi:hypothetical protein